MAAVRGHAPLSEWVAALDALADAAAKTAQHQAGGRSVYAAGAAGAAGGSHGTLSVAKRAVGFSSVGRGAEASRKASTAASKASRWRKEAPKAAAEKAVLLKRRSFAEDLVERLTAGRRRDAKLAKAGVARPPPASGTASSASQGNGKSITTGIASAQPSPAARAAPSAAAPTSLRAPQTCSTTAAFLREESPRPALDARPRRAKGASPRQRSNSPRRPRRPLSGLRMRQSSTRLVAALVARLSDAASHLSGRSFSHRSRRSSQRSSFRSLSARSSRDESQRNSGPELRRSVSEMLGGSRRGSHSRAVAMGAEEDAPFRASERVSTGSAVRESRTSGAGTLVVPALSGAPRDGGLPLPGPEEDPGPEYSLYTA